MHMKCLNRDIIPVTIYITADQEMHTVFFMTPSDLNEILKECPLYTRCSVRWRICFVVVGFSLNKGKLVFAKFFIRGGLPHNSIDG